MDELKRVEELRQEAGKEAPVAVEEGSFEALFMTQEMMARCMPSVFAAIWDLKKAQGASEEQVASALKEEDNPIHKQFTEPLLELVGEILSLGYERMKEELDLSAGKKSLLSQIQIVNAMPRGPAFNPQALPRGSKNRR